MKNKQKTACITGHRPKNLPWGYEEEALTCFKFKAELKKVFISAIEGGIDLFLTGMAEGFDMLATELLLELKKEYNIKIVAIVPFLGQEDRWKESQQERYADILMQCDDFEVLNESYTKNCYNERNLFMVKHSCLCIACWNGLPSGTGNTVRFAKENGNKIKIINPLKFK